MGTQRAPHPRKRRLCAGALALTLALSAFASSLHADPSTSDKATAQILFDEALKLLEKKQYKEACRKLEESLRLDPAMGTKYRLGDCYEKIGKTASAWGLFREVADDAKASGLADREKKARERAAKLEPKLARLTIVVDPANGSGVRVKRDGSDVGEGQLGIAVPVDPGSHAIEASAKGKKPWSSTTEVGTGASVSVTVPKLELEPVVVAEEKVAPPPPKPVDNGGSSQKTVGLIVGGAGVVSLGVSTMLILSARGLVNDAKPYCDHDACEPAGLELRDRARSRGNLASLFFGLGAAMVVGGSVLWFTGTESGSGSSHGRGASLGVGLGFLELRGRF